MKGHDNFRIVFAVDRYDARGRGRNATVWSESPPRGFGLRASFDPHEAPSAQLRIRGVRRGEDGVYRCRVDFRTAQTRNSIVNVSMISKSISLCRKNICLH